MKRATSLAFIFAILLFGNFLYAQLPRSRPDELGFSSERLGKLHAMAQGYIDEGKHAGAISVIARQGKIVDLKTYGYRDLEAHTPMTLDTIVRIYSMSKVITSVAVLQLFEEGRFSLDDPIGHFLPALKNLKVCTGGTAENPTLVDAQ